MPFFAFSTTKNGADLIHSRIGLLIVANEIKFIFYIYIVDGTFHCILGVCDVIQSNLLRSFTLSLIIY